VAWKGGGSLGLALRMRYMVRLDCIMEWVDGATAPGKFYELRIRDAIRGSERQCRDVFVENIVE
jgi:hypothetical protein